MSRFSTPMTLPRLPDESIDQQRIRLANELLEQLENERVARQDQSIESANQLLQQISERAPPGVSESEVQEGGFRFGDQASRLPQAQQPTVPLSDFQFGELERAPFSLNEEISLTPELLRQPANKKSIKQALDDDVFQQSRRNEIESGQLNNAPLKRFNQIRNRLDLPPVNALPPDLISTPSRRVLNAFKVNLAGFAQGTNDQLEGLGDFTQAISTLLGGTIKSPTVFFEESRNVIRAFLPDDPRLRGEFFASQLPAALGTAESFFASGLTGGPGVLLAGGVGLGAREQAATAESSDVSETDKAIAVLLGAGLGATETPLILRLLKVLKPLNRALNGRFFRSILNRGGFKTDVVLETVQELGQQVGSNLIAANILDIDRPLFEGFAEAGKTGASVAALFSGLARLAGIKIRASDRRLAQEAVALVKERPEAAQRLLSESDRVQGVKGPKGVPGKTAFAAEGITEPKNRQERARFIEVAREESQKSEVETSAPAAFEFAPSTASVIAPGRKPLSEQRGAVAGTSNEFGRALREKLKLSDPLEAARRPWPMVMDEAALIIKETPHAAATLIAELREKPRSIEDLETAILLQHQLVLNSELQKIMSQLTKARETKNNADIARLESTEETLLAEITQILDTNKATGKAEGRAFRARQELIAQDFSLIRMLDMERKTRGVDRLDAQQREVIKKLNERIERLSGELNESLARLNEKQGDQDIADGLDRLIKSEKKPRRTKRTIEAKARLEDAWRQLEEFLEGRTFANPLDPALIKQFVRLGKAHIDVQVATFKDFLAAVQKRIGKALSKKLLPGITAAWKEIVDSDLPKPSKALEDAEATARFSQRLAKYFVSTGIREREALIGAVHGELGKLVSGITRRQTMEAMTDYGMFRPLNKGDIETVVRDNRGQIRQLLKLEDMEAGRAPPKGGFEQSEPSDVERLLRAEVNEAKKKGGFVVTDPDSQLQSALAGIKKRLRNQIVDLNKQIADGEKFVKSRIDLPQDQEVLDLVVQRDAAKVRFEQIFGNPELSDKQRLRNATQAARRSVIELRRRIRDKDLKPKKRKAAVRANTELQALRDEQIALRSELQHLRDLANPKKTVDQRNNEAFRARTLRRIADFQDRLARNDFAPKTRKVLKLDKASREIAFQLEKVKKEYMDRLQANLRAQRTVIRKVFGVGVDLVNSSRAIVTSYDVSAVGRQGAFIGFGNPTRVARALLPMIGAVTRRGAFRVQQDIENRKNFKSGLYKRAGLELTEIDGTFTTQEEVYRANLSRFIPGVKLSERVFTTYLNRLRVDTFDAMIATLGKGGTISEAEAAVIANFVNISNGRGDLGQLGNASRLLGTVFFSPRFAVSRFQVLTLQPLRRKGNTLRTRKLIAKEYGKFILGIGITLSTIAAALKIMVGELGDDKEADIENDTLSSDFGKVRIGDKRIDLLAGMSQATVFMNRFVRGKRKVLSTGETIPITGRRFVENISSFVRNKLSPATGSIIDIFSQKDFKGDPITTKTIIVKLLVPISYQDVISNIEKEGLPTAAAMALMEFVGFGAQNFDTTIPVKKKLSELSPRERRQRLKDRVATRNRNLIKKFRRQKVVGTSGMIRAFKKDFIEKHPATKLGSRSYRPALREFRRALRDAGI